ncbi:MAG: carboxypeptidase regulatory-like domain-containing protein [Candidatus Hydrogenedentes bacterium]|nr:carboxypeptidase regulatory-like domain-containing protein [Candidatus Hydrogenedentota bacterium]
MTQVPVTHGYAVLSLWACILMAGLLSSAGEDVPQHAPSGFGSIEGRVRFLGTVPRAEVPDNAGRRRPILNVEGSDNDLRYAVVYLSGPEAEKASPGEEISVDSASGITVIDQRDLAFVPHLVAVRSGQRVAFSNSDPENHNVRAQAELPRNRFNILTGSGLDYERQFQPEPNDNPVRLSCDIHPWMSAWVFAFDHPYFDVTGEHGLFSIEAVPAGTYSIVVYQPDGRLRAEGQVAVAAGDPARLNVEFSQTHLGGARILKIETQRVGPEEGPAVPG